MIIIPARLKSTRFPEKILKPVGKNNLPMFAFLYHRLSSIDEVVVAIDDVKTEEIAKKYDVKYVMTSQEHESGSDRLYEVVEKLELDSKEIIINVQADEPLIELNIILELKEVMEHMVKKDKFLLEKNSILMTTFFQKINDERAKDYNNVKVVINDNNEAMYFSRSVIPFDRDKKEYIEYKHHLGIYGFTAGSLKKFCRLSGTLEHIEKLEQLRVLENGYKIKMIETETHSIGVDTPEDYEKLNELLKEKGL